MAETTGSGTAGSGNVNSTLDYRRQERADQLMQESVGRISETTSIALEIYQKQIAFTASLFHYWGDTLNAAQTSMGHMIQQTHRVADQVRRTG
jgi:hypothetical protein